MAIDWDRIDHLWFSNLLAAHADWLADEENRQKEADRRNRDLVQVHRDGWKQTADAVLKGFGLVADAIRDSRR